MGRSLNYWLVGESVDDNQVITAFVMEEVSTNTLEWVDRGSQRSWRRTRIGRRNPIAMVASSTEGGDGRGDAGPVDRCLCPGGHGGDP